MFDVLNRFIKQNADKSHPDKQSVGMYFDYSVGNTTMSRGAPNCKPTSR
jgi:hypothetical protein